MASIKDYTPKQKVRISRKLAKRKADLSQTKVKIKPQSGLVEFEISKGPKKASGYGTYHRKFVDKPRFEVLGIKAEEPGLKKSSLFDLHKKVKGKVLDKTMIKEGLTAIKKAYPKAGSVVGSRVTGAKEGKFGGAQAFNLGRLGKIGKKASVMGMASEVLNLPQLYRTFKHIKKQRKNYEKWGTPHGGST